MFRAKNRFMPGYSTVITPARTCMRIHSFESELWLPQPVEQVFNFFSDATNLQKLTPDWLGFELLTPSPIQIGRGTLIDYRLSLHGIPVKWQTENTAWEPPHRFVDEQRRGPYLLWVHEHRFTARENGTLVNDLVRYAVPGGWLVDRLFVRRDVEKIFQFRRARLRELFPALP
ncbi:MAG TPA: SRPBCC family protein [Verrucomicrobiae bacterium]